MARMSNTEYEQLCTPYFESLGKRGVSTSAIRKAVKSIRTKRTFKYVGRYLQVSGPDIVASPDLDQAIIEAFATIPSPTRNHEKQFIITRKEIQGKKLYVPSKIFSMPENGGRVIYECWLREWIDWSTVEALAHTHPLYWDEATNRENKRFSDGDPTGVIIKEVPVYMRTPRARQIKVLELRGGFITTRTLGPKSSGGTLRWKKSK